LLASEIVKIEGSSWHRAVESKSPITALLHSDFYEEGASLIDSFAEGLKPLWDEILSSRLKAPSTIVLENTYAKIYGSLNLEEISNESDPLRQQAFMYVLLGSSMGAAYIFKALSEKGYTNLLYFEHTRSLAPEFLKLKKSIDENVKGEDLTELIRFVGEAYSKIQF
jgi:hypothetical protein